MSRVTGTQVSLIWIGLVLLAALLAQVIEPHDVRALDLRARLQPPFGFGGTWDHLLGTDELGRDVLSRLLRSVQVSVLIAGVATLLSTTIGVALGFVAARLRGWVDQSISAVIDAQSALPFVVLALAVVALWGNSLTLFVTVLGLYRWEKVARLARGLALAAQQQGYVRAVTDLGAGSWRIYTRHVLPNVAPTLIVNATLQFPEVILLESGLSFLGLGIQPPLASLGNMVGFGRAYLASAPWILLAPCAVIVVTTWAICICADDLRERLDPGR